MQSKLTIRFARENDWDEIEQITSQNFSFQGLADTGSDSLRVLILEFEDQVIGACILQTAKQAQAYLTLLSRNTSHVEKTGIWHLIFSHCKVPCRSGIFFRDSHGLSRGIGLLF